MIEDKFPTIFEIFEETCKKNLQKEAISFKINNTYTCLSYHDLYNLSVYFSHVLQENKIGKNDSVAIILENSLYWPVAFLGIMRIGATAVPLSPQTEEEELTQLISHSEAKIIITSTSIEQRFKGSRRRFSIPILTLDAMVLLERSNLDYQEMPPEKFSSDKIASIVYTSGTTAAPKGVVLTHKNLLANFYSLKKLNLIMPNDCLICILPFHHAYPFMVNLLIPLLTGAKISFPQNLNFEELMECVKKNRVTIFVGVPRIFALLCEKINSTIQSLPAYKRFFLKVSLDLAIELRKSLRINLSKVIMKELHQKFGNYFRFFVSGGAKLNKDVTYDFYKWGFTILEGYGLTESSPVVSFNTPAVTRMGSVGKPIPGVEVRIRGIDETNTGEISVKGENVTSGYYKDTILSQQTIRDGWLFTHDIGYIDNDGFIFITGRKNEIIVLSSGKKINPEDLEVYYSKSPYIKEICIFLPAHDKDLLTAVILPHLEYFQAHGVAQIKDKIRFEIENLSVHLPAYKRIKKYTVINEALPRTLLGKIKRFEIEKKYSNIQAAEEKKAVKELSLEDQLLLSSELCQKIIENLSLKLKRPINLDDHLELDLGLDSLERISLFFELQNLAGFDLDEKAFFYVSTVRDVINRVHAIAETKLQKVEAAGWKKILNGPPSEKIKENISIAQPLLAKTTNVIFFSLLRAISRLFFPIKVKGKENIPKKGPVVFCPNHTSYLDPPLFAVSLGIPTLLHTYFMGFSAYINNPLLSWGKKLFRLIPIDPASNIADTLMACSFVLNNSKALCMFPEGGRSIDGKIKEFKRGVGVLIKELNVDVVPVYIKGAYTAWPPGKILPRPGKIEINFGKRITVEGLTSHQIKDIDIYQNIANNLKQELLKLQEY